MSFAALLSRLDAGHGVSGPTLAKALGVSRAAVWKQIEQLRALGLGIEARPGAGYRLQAPLELLDARTIRMHLDAAARRRLAALEIVEQTGSTHADLLARAGTLASGSVLLAEAQTAGRGQRGRRWESPFGSGFLGSVLWRYPQGLAALSGLSLAIGVAVAEALAGFGFKARLKWPNDLVSAQGKLGGILIDAAGEVQGPCQVVVGLGLNLRLPDASRQRIDQPALALEQLGATPLPSRNALAAAVIAALLAALAEFGRDGFAAFTERFQAYDALYGSALTVHAGRELLSGRGQGIDASGRLALRLYDGTVRHFAVGEVRVRGAGP